MRHLTWSRSPAKGSMSPYVCIQQGALGGRVLPSLSGSEHSSAQPGLSRHRVSHRAKDLWGSWHAYRQRFLEGIAGFVDQVLGSTSDDCHGRRKRVTAPESPWQNSRAERHGGWLKGKLKQEAKNRLFNAGGYTPVQLVFGELPRVPGELLSNDTGGLIPLSV